MATRAVSTVSLLLLSAVLAVPACQKGDDSSSGSAAAASGKVNPGAPTLELFVMSKCPYGIQAENAVAEAKEKLGPDLNVKIGFIGAGKPGAFKSLHGPTEVKGDLAQVCANKMAPDKLLAMITCQNKNPREIGDNWRDCAKQVGIDADKLATCAEGDEGGKLLAAAFDEAKDRKANASPTIFLDGKAYEGGRKGRDFLKAACSATKGDKPEACKHIPVPPVVHSIFLSDARCKECAGINRLEPRLRGELGGLVVEHVDYASDRGKALYKELKEANPSFKYLPVILLDPEVEKDADGYNTLKRFMRPLGKYKELMLGGHFDPTAEICDNGGVDDDSDGKADCKDSDCKEAMECRPEKKGSLDLFVMSHCPYGTRALIAAKQVIDHFGKEMTLNVHFIGGEKDGKLNSMHGPAEVAEDLREVCATKHYAKNEQFMGYLACRSENIKDDNWQACAEKAGMDAKVIQSCSEGDEGQGLLKKSFALSDALQIQSSPTFLANNRRTFNAQGASSIQEQFCKDNPGLSKCKDKIDSGSAAATAQQQAAPAGGACGAAN